MELKQPETTRTQKKEIPNTTGIPSQMKADFDTRGGLFFDDVRVTYISGTLSQIDAPAYTQSTQVRIGPSQEKYLPHELGHVVQQKRSIMHPNACGNRTALSTGKSMERQAGKMAPCGACAVQSKLSRPVETGVIQRTMRINKKSIGMDEADTLVEQVCEILRKKGSLLDGDEKLIKNIICGLVGSELSHKFKNIWALGMFVLDELNKLYPATSDGEEDAIESPSEEDAIESSSEEVKAGPEPPAAPIPPFSKPKPPGDSFQFLDYTGETVRLFRSMSPEEYAGLEENMMSGRPMFEFKGQGDKGETEIAGEKYFTTNLKYLATPNSTKTQAVRGRGNRPMAIKGDRGIIVKVELHPTALSDLLYNPEKAGVMDSMRAGGSSQSAGNKLNTVHAGMPIPIVLKQESNVCNFGFRTPQILEELSRYIVSVQKIEDFCSRRTTLESVQEALGALSALYPATLPPKNLPPPPRS